MELHEIDFVFYLRYNILRDSTKIKPHIYVIEKYYDKILLLHGTPPARVSV